MAVKISFIQNTGIYGFKPRDGYATSLSSPFAIFKDDSGDWAIAQMRAGLVINALIPPRIKKSKNALLDMVRRMETAKPEACAIVGALPSGHWPEDVKPFGRELIDWARTCA